MSGFLFLNILNIYRIYEKFDKTTGRVKYATSQWGHMFPLSNIRHSFPESTSRYIESHNRGEPIRRGQTLPIDL